MAMLKAAATPVEGEVAALIAVRPCYPDSWVPQGFPLAQAPFCSLQYNHVLMEHLEVVTELVYSRRMVRWSLPFNYWTTLR